MNKHKHLMAAAAASFCVSAWAAGNASNSTSTTPQATTPPAATADANRISASEEREQLEKRLQAVNSRADYAKAIEAEGYRIAAINADKPDYLEYEVVKEGRSAEVQLDFDKKNAGKASKIDVTANMWRADSTKQMLKDPAYRHTTALTADPQSRYSDRRYMKSWTDEKDRLERALPKNQSVAVYKKMIEQQGYQITSVNDREADYVEYEIVKGDNSYEVQIDLDPKSKLGTKIDVTSNLWDSEGTEHAKDKQASVHK